MSSNPLRKESSLHDLKLEGYVAPIVPRQPSLKSMELLQRQPSLKSIEVPPRLQIKPSPRAIQAFKQPSGRRISNTSSLLMDRSLNPPRSISIENELYIKMLSEGIKNELTSEAQRTTSFPLSAPVLINSSIHMTTIPYEIILQQCFTEFITAQYPDFQSEEERSKIDINIYNTRFIEFILYSLYSTFKSSTGNNITEFSTTLNSIDIYISYIYSEFNKIINSIDIYDTFNNYFETKADLIRDYSAIKEPERSNKINELDILKYLLNSIKKFLTPIFDILIPTYTLRDNIANVNEVIDRLFNNENKVKIYLLFSTRTIQDIFEKVNFKVIFLKLTSLTMKEKMKKIYITEDSSIFIENYIQVWQNYSIYVNHIEKIIYFFQILYFFYKKTIHRLNTENLNSYRSVIEREILELQQKSISLQSRFVTKLIKSSSLDSISKASSLIDMLSKERQPFYEKDIAGCLVDLKKQLTVVNEDTDITHNVNVLDRDISSLRKSNLFRGSIPGDPKLPQIDPLKSRESIPVQLKLSEIDPLSKR